MQTIRILQVTQKLGTRQQGYKTFK